MKKQEQLMTPKPKKWIAKKPHENIETPVNLQNLLNESVEMSDEEETKTLAKKKIKRKTTKVEPKKSKSKSKSRTKSSIQ
jgi:hypothetical protein